MKKKAENALVLAEVDPNALKAKYLLGSTLPLPESLTSLVRESPFKPADIPAKMIWTASSIKQFRQCPRKFFWKYMYRLRQRYPGAALKLGTAFHECLGAWYRSKRSSMAKIVAPVFKELNELLEKEGQFYDDEEREKLSAGISSFRGMMMGYAEVHKADRDTWKFHRDIGIEREFLIDCGDFYYAGSIDGVPQVMGCDWVLEHKTASNISESYVGRLALDTQSRGYMFAIMAITGKMPKGTIYNVTQKTKLRRKSDESWESYNSRVAQDYMAQPDKYYYREQLMFTSADIRAFCLELWQTHQMFKLITNSKMATNPRAWPIDDQACSAWFKMCEYHSLCTIGLDHGTSLGLEQMEKLHMELGNVDI